jgi:hypothetical protein
MRSRANWCALVGAFKQLALVGSPLRREMSTLVQHIELGDFCEAGVAASLATVFCPSMR